MTQLPITEEWIKKVLPTTKSHGKGADYKGDLGSLCWQGAGPTFVVWLNGALYEIDRSSRDRFRLLAIAIGVELREPF